MKAIFHAGMGKTGSSTIQAVLAQNEESLESQGVKYLGRWLPWLGPQYVGVGSFQKFQEFDAPGLENAAQAYVDHVTAIAGETGIQRFLTSNESFYASAPFFAALASRCDLTVIIYIREAAKWLPSAYVQWGILHKTNKGPVQPFSVTGRRLMSHYRAVAQLRRVLGDRLVLRPFPEGGDVVEDFAQVLGVTLASDGKRRQTRPSVPDSLMRASYNSAFPEPKLPWDFDSAMGLGGKRAGPRSLSEKHAHLFDYQEIPAIIEENRELLERLGEALGHPLAQVPDGSERRFDLSDAVDGVLGRLVDLASAQAARIAALEERLAAVEARSEVRAEARSEARSEQA